jgi:hypothetical protein
MIFHFVVRHLHFLARIPLAPQIFDAMLLTWTALVHRSRLRAIERFEREALRLPNVELCIHHYGGLGFKYGGREFAHLHSNGLLDVQLTCALAEELIKSTRALPHHVLGQSKWISFWMNTESDLPAALNFLQQGFSCAQSNCETITS